MCAQAVRVDIAQELESSRLQESNLAQSTIAQSHNRVDWPTETQLQFL